MQKKEKKRKGVTLFIHFRSGQRKKVNKLKKKKSKLDKKITFREVDPEEKIFFKKWQPLKLKNTILILNKQSLTDPRIAIMIGVLYNTYTMRITVEC